MTAFAELHCHSNFSFLDGASSVEDLVERAVDAGLTGLALTDHQGLYGAVRFATAAHEAGLNAIVGMEVELLDPIAPDPDGIIVAAAQASGASRTGDQLGVGAARAPDSTAAPSGRASSASDHRVTASHGARTCAAFERASSGRTSCSLARDMSGYRSLCRLASNAQLAGTKGAPRFTHDRLSARDAGVDRAVGLPPRRDCAAAARGRSRRRKGRRAQARGSLPRRASTWSCSTTCCPTTTGSSPRRCASRASSSLPLVVTNDAHYALPADRELQDVLVCIRHGKTLEESGHLRRPNGEYYLKGMAELRPAAAGDGRAG